MGKILDRILAKTGRTVEDLPRNTALGKLTRRRGVGKSPELERIKDLPTREWDKDPDLGELVQLLTEALKTPLGKQTLRPVQAKGLQEAHDFGGLLGCLNVGEGKAQPIDEPVLTPEGWREIGSLSLGDSVIGSDGRPHAVLGVFPQGTREVFKVSFSDGSWTRSCAEHLWTFRHAGLSKTSTLPLRDWQKKPLKRKAGPWQAHCWFVPMVEPVDRPVVALPLDPYTLGALIGDGGLTGDRRSGYGTPYFTSMDPDIVGGLVLPTGVALKKTTHQSSGRATSYAITTGKKGNERNTLTHILRELELWGHRSESKFIPLAYKQASIPQRLALLQGLFDTDGSVSRQCVEYSTASPQLATDVIDMVESLGGTATYGVHKTTHLDSHRLLVKIPSQFRPFRCARKDVQDLSKRQRPPYRALTSIVPDGRAECVCISVDSPDHLYVTRNHILTHNTLLSLLSAAILESKRPLLILPAKLEKKTEGEIEILRQHWKIPRHLQIISYERLGVVSGADFLEKYQPDLIVADEVHRLKNLKAARTRRMRRYMDAYPDTVFIALSGTIMRKSLRDYHHIQAWALPEALQPLPRKWTELQDWADALDARTNRRMAPGALMELCLPGEDKDLSGVRQAFGRRLVQTPGVIMSTGPGIPCSLTIDCETFDSFGPEIEDAADTLHRTWVLPDDWTLADGVVKWGHVRQLARGFYYRWNPRPPKDWLNKRRDWHSFARDKIQTNKQGIDSELAVIQACDRGIWDNTHLEAWRAIRDTFKYQLETVWLDYAYLAACADWLEKERGICWVEHVEFGSELADLTGYPFYGAGGVDQKTGAPLLSQKKGPIICSIPSIGEGHNLQDRWHKALVSCWPGSGQVCEQMIGRIHRLYQESDEVDIKVFLCCKEDYAALQKSREEQEATGDSTQNRSMKLRVADIVCPTTLELSLKRSPLWAPYGK